MLQWLKHFFKREESTVDVHMMVIDFLNDFGGGFARYEILTVEMEKTEYNTIVAIRSTQPGLLIGKRGSFIKRLEKYLEEKLNDRVNISLV
jgi:ribosomal protein S3